MPVSALRLRMIFTFVLIGCADQWPRLKKILPPFTLGKAFTKAKYELLEDF